jgi:hypothetical protein
MNKNHIKHKLDKIHFNKGDRVKFRLLVTAGISGTVVFGILASITGVPHYAHVGTFINLVVSLIWVWE